MDLWLLLLQTQLLHILLYSEFTQLAAFYLQVNICPKMWNCPSWDFLKLPDRHNCFLFTPAAMPSDIIPSKVSISVFTLLAMTLERHKAIMTPLAPRKSHKTLWVRDLHRLFLKFWKFEKYQVLVLSFSRPQVAICLIWVGGGVVAAPALIYSTLYTRQVGLPTDGPKSCKRF